MDQLRLTARLLKSVGRFVIAIRAGGTQNQNTGCGHKCLAFNLVRTAYEIRVMTSASIL